VTENSDSPLARESDLLLRVRVEKEADTFNMLATTSTLAVISVFDAVCIALMQHTGYTREQFAVIHPGGAVGERLVGGKD
jgi:D-arabinose 5-phosphate isomerase GutQ